MQQSLTLNQTCGDLLLNLEQMDIDLAIKFLDHTKHFLGANNDQAKAIHQHHLYLLDVNSAAMKQLQDFHGSVKHGNISYPIVESLMKLGMIEIVLM